MRRCEIKSIADKLAAIPEQSIVKSTYVYTNEPSSGRLLNVTSQLHGKGKIKTYHVFPGVEILYISVSQRHIPMFQMSGFSYYSILGRLAGMERARPFILVPVIFQSTRVLCKFNDEFACYYEGIMISLDSLKLFRHLLKG